MLIHMQEQPTEIDYTEVYIPTLVNLRHRGRNTGCRVPRHHARIRRSTPCRGAGAESLAAVPSA